MMVDDNAVYFCTSRGKYFYEELMATKKVATVGLTRDWMMLRLNGEVTHLDDQKEWIDKIFEENPAMDEPFGAVDAITRTSLQDELLRLHGDLKKTFLFVTHDINEAFKMGGRTIIMNHGSICQFDTPKEIIKNPADEFVRSLVQSAIDQEKFWNGVEIGE